MAQQEMVFGDYLRVLLKRKWTVLFLTVLVLVATYSWSLRQDPVFTSTARIKLQSLQSSAGGGFGQQFGLSGGGDPLENCIYAIQGDTVLKTAAAHLTGVGYPTDKATLLRAISASRLERTDLIDISARGPTADIAQRRCAEVVRTLIETRDDMLSANAREEYAQFQKSLVDATNSLAQLDAEMRTRLEALNVPDATGQAATVLRTKLLDASIRLQALRDQGNYTEEYPEIVALKSAVKLLESQLKQSAEKESRVQQVMGEYEQKKRVLAEMVGFLTRRVEEARITQKRETERIEIIEQPSPGVTVLTGTAYLVGIGLMLGLMLGIVFAFVAENLDASIRTLVEIEETFHLSILGVIPHFSPDDPEVPIRPDTFWDRMKYSLKTNSVVIVWRATWSAFSRRSGRDRLKPSRSPVMIVPFSSRAPATEGFRSIRTHLQLAAGEGKVGAVLVTSAGPGEGKSTTISNLAFAFAQAGKKTLLVCANMRRPSLHKTFGLSRECGLSDILVGEVAWRAALKDHCDIAIGERADEGLATAVGAANLFFIACGGKTIQPAEWLSLPMFEATVREWEAEFDIVLIDGPPILPVPDSIIISSVVRQVVLVYRAGATDRDSMLRAISLIQKAGAKIAGLVLNDLKASQSTSPDYFHYRGYYGRPEKS